MFKIMLGEGLVLHLLLHGSDAVRVHCQHMERIHEDHIHYCCKHPDGHNDVTEMCAKQTNFKLPSRDEEAIEDVTVEHAMNGLCWGKCVFDHYNFLMKNGSLDMAAVREHYKTVHKLDPEYETEMLQAFDHCHGESEDAAAKFASNPFFQTRRQNSCDATSSVILSCVIYNFFHNCPKSRWSDTAECAETLAFAKKCKDALTTM